MASKTAAKPIKIDAAIQTSLRSRRVCATGGLSGPAWSGWARRALRDSAMTADPAVRVGPAHRPGGKRGDARESSPRVVDGDGGRARVERRDAGGAGGEGNARGSLTNAARRRGATTPGRAGRSPRRAGWTRRRSRSSPMRAPSLRISAMSPPCRTSPKATKTRPPSG
jgi:hypothetical protein